MPSSDFEQLRQSHFWQRKSLAQLSEPEWEALCDGCAKCCLVKLEDEDEPGAVYYTDLACEFLNTQTCRCSDYPNRLARKPDCIDLEVGMVSLFHWLPSTCAYRLLSENKPLPDWHPLNTGEQSSCLSQGQSVANRVVSEALVTEELHQDHIIHWVD